MPKLKNSIILIGGGGHGRVVIDAIKSAKSFNIYGILDPSLRRNSIISGVKVIGPDGMLPILFKNGIKNAFISVGSIGDHEPRKKIYGNLKKIGFRLPSVVHPKAVVAGDVRLGEGAFVAAGAILNPGVKIGRNAIINTRSSVDHDCGIGDFVHVAPGAVLSGGVKIKEGAHIGTGASVIQNIKIGKNAMIGAGQTVRVNISDGARYFERLEPRRHKKVFIIAEAGVNHNGSLKTAKDMVDAACRSGADAVKFQTFKAGNIVSRFSPKADYQKRSTGKKQPQFDMIKKLELDRNAHIELVDYCRKKKIIFLSSPFDPESIDLLDGLGLEIFKIPSGEITNLPYLRKIGRLRKKIIMSTGMSNLKEIKAALDILTKAGTPKKNITVLHCNTEYPTPFEDADLLAMTKIKYAFGVNVGYSDHTPGIEAPIAAAALGAVVIEKHFTLDKSMPGPDHKASLGPDELNAMVAAIRNIEKALGSGRKKPSPSEAKNKAVVRKSIVASKAIKTGEVFTEENITAKRPATGMSPIHWDKVIGRTAKKDFKRDESICL